jgi:hypothetical protein
MRILSFNFGLSCIILGMVYILPFFGEMESEVVYWGYISVGSGILYLIYSKWHSPQRGVMYNFSFFFYLILIVTTVSIQIPPIVLWFSYHGSPIHDSSPGSPLMGHYLFSIPHLLCTALGIALAIKLIKGQLALYQ